MREDLSTTTVVPGVIPGTPVASKFGADYDAQSQNRLFGTSVFDANYKRFQDFISQYSGNTELYNRLKDLYQFQSYSPGNKESFWGDTSGITDFYNRSFDTAMADARQLIDEYNQRSYNDPSSQNARMKQAGINTELNGGQSLTPGEAGDATPETPPATPISHDIGSSPALDLGLSTINFAKDIFTSTLGLYDMFKGIGIKDATLALGDLNVTKNAYDLALETESGKIAPRRMFYKKSDGSYDWEKMASDFFLDPTTKVSGKTTRAQRALAHAREGLYYDDNGVVKPGPALQSAILGMDKQISDDAVSYAKNRSEPGYDPEGVLNWASTLAKTQTAWRLKTMEFESKAKELEYDIRKSQQRAIAAEAGYQEQYYGTTDENGRSLGAAAGEAALAGFDADKSMRQVDKLRADWNHFLEKSRKSLYSTVYGDGKWFGKLGTLALPGIMDSFDSLSGRFLDHLDGLIDILINPAGKAVGAALGKLVK